MSLAGTIESVQEIKSDAAKFFEVFTRKPHHISDRTHHINKCGIHEGEPGVVGSIIHWDFIHDGKAKVAKMVIEAIDDGKHSITLKLIEGPEVLNEYKTFITKVQATDKEDGTGSFVRWTIEYEKVNASFLAPTRYLDMAIHIVEGIDQHIQEELAAAA